jgi:hypothetical protein
MLSKAIVSVTLLVLVLTVAAAQVSYEKVGFIPPTVAEPLPFKIGETLSYKVTYSKHIFSGTIGELKLTVSKPPVILNPRR